MPSIEAVEWYALMQPDIKATALREVASKYLVEYGKNYETALDFMSLCGVRKNDRMMNDVIDILLRNAPSRFPTIALSTFIPLLSQPHKSDLANFAINALVFVANLAAAVWEEQKGRIDCRIGKRIVIELVAGSRVRGIQQTQSTGSSKYEAVFMRDTEARENCINNLKSLILRCKEIEDRILWAIELEPGQLFTVRDWKTLCYLCDSIQNSEELSSSVGVNLDIGHWEMAKSFSNGSAISGISPDLVRNSSVYRSIAHAHVSSHDKKAHFGDQPINYLKDSDWLSPWIALLRERAGDYDSLIEYSGFVSLELEASRSTSKATLGMSELALMTART